MSQIVMITDLGDVWLSQDEARKAATAQAKGTKNITLRGNVYHTSTIRGFLQPDTYRSMYTSKKRSWTCQHGNVHLWNEFCSCGRQLKPTEAKQLEAKNQMTPKQQALADLRAEASREWIKKCGKDWKLMGDKEKRNAFIAKYVEEHNV